MSRLRLKYIQSFGGYHYFRRPGYARTRLPGLPGSAEFMAAYQMALDATPQAIGEAKRSLPGSVSASIAAFYKSTAWNEKPDGGPVADGTKGMRRAILERFRSKYGHLPLGQLHPKFLTGYLNQFKPHARRNTFKVMRVWLRQTGHDVTRGMDAPKARSNKHPSWLPEQIAAFERAHPIGSKARLCFALARYTGAGCSEIARMGPKHLKAGEITIARKKTGVEATIEVHPSLQAVLDGTPLTGLTTWLVTKSGRPFAATDLSEQFRAWCNEAGLPVSCRLHGLRHTMGDTLADSGADVFEIASTLGHKDARSALHYTQGVNRKRASRRAMQKLIQGTADEHRVSKDDPGLTVDRANTLKAKANR